MRRRGPRIYRFCGRVWGGLAGLQPSAKKRLHVCDNCAKKETIETYDRGDFDKGQQEVKCLPLSHAHGSAGPRGISSVCSLKKRPRKKSE